MPKFVGQSIPGTLHAEDNATCGPRGSLPNHVRLSYSQIKILADSIGPGNLVASLDTSDKGGRGSYAKRWFRWFAYYRDVLTCEQSTPKMRAAALVVDNRIREAAGLARRAG